MKTTTPVLLVLAAALAACSSDSMQKPVYLGNSGDRGPMKLIEGPVVKPPANDISEAQRIAWFEANRPVVEPVATEHASWRDYEPVRYGHCDDPSWLWAIPLSLSFGYASGGGHHHDGGWGVGATWGWGGWH